MSFSWRKFFVVAGLALTLATGGACGKGDAGNSPLVDDGSNNPNNPNNPPLANFKFEGEYLLLDAILASKAHPEITQSVDVLAISGLLKANPTGSAILTIQGASCVRDNSNNCLAGESNVPSQFLGKWKANSDGTYQLSLKTEAGGDSAVEVILNFKVDNSAGYRLLGSQTNLDQAKYNLMDSNNQNYSDGFFKTFDLYQIAGSYSNQSLAGEYFISNATSFIISNDNFTRKKPLLEMGTIDPKVTFDGNGKAVLEFTNAITSTSNTAELQYQVLDNSHVKFTTIGTTPTSNILTMRLVPEDGRLTFWDYNEMNTFPPASTPESATHVTDLFKIK
ncbi:MAG: hypothetical protein JNK65_06740 [Deltaproteobacteria bacterium]|nr:hypothetical protein [Deltaproteobacteria bacterium]